MASLRSRVTGPNQRASTRFTKDGQTAFVTLEVDRRTYEFCRRWAIAHYGRLDGNEHPEFTAEDQLQGYLNAAMSEALEDAPAAFDAIWPAPPLPEHAASYSEDHDDIIPF